MKLKEIIKYVNKYESITLTYKGDTNAKFNGTVFELYDDSLAHNELLKSEVIQIGATLFNLCIELKKGEKK